jgi:hypothetical protein
MSIKFWIISISAFLYGVVALEAQPVAGLNAEAPPPVELFFSIEGGFYPGQISVEISSPSSRVYFTTDGSKPGKRSYQYNRPITIRETVTIRAIAFHEDGRKSDIVSHTYLIDEPSSNLAVVAIAVSPSVLFHPSHGIFMQGNNAIDSLWKKPGANFWSKKEVPASVEIFEADGSCVYRSLSGFRLFGGMSRLFPQKSIAIVARNRYGEKRIRHNIFGKGQPKKYKYLVLRNSGSDFGKTHFRDAFMTSLVDDWDIDKQAYRPSHVYINGNYWGIYNIREKVNRYFIESHHQDIDKDSIDLIEHRYTRKRGSIQEYKRLLAYLEEHSLEDPAHYAYIKSVVDIENFMDYQIAQIYFDNQDAGGNIKFWRPQKAAGKWRWILYDTDWGFGLHNPEAYLNNSLGFHTAPDGPAWPNPPWSTFLLRKFLENEDFRRTFVNRMAGHLNTCFHPAAVHQKIDSFYRVLLPEIDRHLSRWKLSRAKWEEEVNVLHTFARERAAYVRMHMMGHFQTGGQRRLVISTNRGGQVILNDHITITNDTLEAIYFERYPIKLKVVAHHGYRFSHWEGIGGDATLRELTLGLSKKVTRMHAVFEPFVHPLDGKVVINEVCPKNNKSGDWVELFNNSSKQVAMKGWVLGDLKRNEFVFPEVYIAPNDYLIICRDSARFMSAFPEAYNVIGGLGFGLNKRKENLGLYSILGAVIDSVSYEVPPVDSSFTLNMPLPRLDNSDPENWEFSYGDGSPNAANPYYVESKVKNMQARWMQTGLAAGVFLLGLILLFFRQKGML